MIGSVDPVVQLRGVTRRFGDTVALDGVDLSVAAGELLAVLGPSGGGKSTLLRLVAGLDQPDAGSISIAGAVVAGPVSAFVPPERRRVGLVFQDHALFPHLTVAGNVGFGLPRRPRSARAERVAELLELVRLADKADRYPHELSGGEQQRVALARALAPRPAVVLLDEPFASLDAQLRRALADDVAAILRAEGSTAILVTHDREEAFAVADRVAVVHAGRLVQDGVAPEVFGAPGTVSVATLLGDATLVPLEVLTRALPGLRTTDGGPSSPELVVLLRPHQLHVVPTAAADAVSASATVTDTRFRGDHLLVGISLAGLTLTAEADPGLPVAPGGEVRVALVPDTELPLYADDALVGVARTGGPT